MKKFVLIILLLVINNTTHAEVTKFVFKTDPQTVETDLQSKTITIQSQNSSGEEEDISETMDLVFKSTSSTGQFLSTSGNPVSTTMSKNTANKNFIYQDPTSGTYTITVTATGRMSLKEFSTSQKIIIGDGGSVLEDSTSSNENNKSGQTNQVPNSVSKSSLEVSLGKNRVAVLGSSVDFIANVIKPSNAVEGITYQWSFGDGGEASGKNVSHIYRFAGDYTVVLNSHLSSQQSSSRIYIKIFEPNVLLEKVSGGLKILNKSDFELNLGGFNLSSPFKTFTFPKDTIINDHSEIIFSEMITGISGHDIRLINPIGQDISDTSKKVESHIEAKNYIPKITDTNKRTVSIYTKNNKIDIASSSGTTSPSSSTVVFVATKNKNIVSRFFGLPARGISYIKHLFIED